MTRPEKARGLGRKQKKKRKKKKREEIGKRNNMTDPRFQT